MSGSAGEHGFGIASDVGGARRPPYGMASSLGTSSVQRDESVRSVRSVMGVSGWNGARASSASSLPLVTRCGVAPRGRRSLCGCFGCKPMFSSSCTGMRCAGRGYRTSSSSVSLSSSSDELSSPLNMCSTSSMAALVTSVGLGGRRVNSGSHRPCHASR